MSILSADIGYIGKVCCVLEWTTRAEFADTFFQMLATLATNPTRDFKNLDLEVESAPEVKRPNRGVSALSFAITLRGLLGLEITIFHVRNGPSARPCCFVSQINEWIQQRCEACLAVSFLEKLLPELSVIVYRCVPHPQHPVIGPLTASMATSCMRLFQVYRRMMEEILPLFYGDCVFKLRATSNWRHARIRGLFYL